MGSDGPDGQEPASRAPSALVVVYLIILVWAALAWIRP
jgi:hypothetical protein